MSRRPRRNHSPEFKAKVTLAAIQGEKHSRNWPSNSTSMSTKSSNGRNNYKHTPPVSLVVQNLKPNQPTSSRCTLKSVNSPWRMIF